MFQPLLPVYSSGYFRRGSPPFVGKPAQELERQDKPFLASHRDAAVEGGVRAACFAGWFIIFFVSFWVDLKILLIVLHGFV